MSTVSEEIIEINIKKKKPRAKKTESRRGRKPKEEKVLKKEVVNPSLKIQIKLKVSLKKEVVNLKKHLI